MKQNQLLIVVICVLSFTNFNGQTLSKNNSFDFSIGYNVGALKNLEIAPVSRYDYNSAIYKFKYQRITKKEKIFEVQLDYLQSEVENNVSSLLNFEYTKIGISVASLKKIYNKNRLLIHVGLESYSDLSLYDINPNNQFVFDQTLGLSSRFSYQINQKQHLFSKLTLPTLLLRITNSNANVYSLNRFQSILWKIGYSYSFSEQLSGQLSYDFNYDRLQISNAFRELQYQVNLGINYKF
ncbi:hypothetical protein GCM10009430_46360 [Aquimarina litoralis]|uniref:Outer membrane protein beta-barrel domain-containing protein n=1 Tax=Aquimarina litoralis TaxID=584605 RepID=A0ABN1J9V7_9FLAO